MRNNTDAAGADVAQAETACVNETWRAWLLSDQPHSRTQARLGCFYRTWAAFLENRLAVFGLAIVLGLVLMATFADVLAPTSPVVGGDLRTERLLPPSAAHWFGTDDQARDLFSRIVHGARLTLLVVALVALIATPIGLLVGTVAGYFGGLIDQALMRVTDIFLAFPRLILALAFVAALGPGIENAILAIAITSWPPYARIARAETLTIRNADYINAVRLQGASSLRIIWGHIVPLCISSVIIRVTLDMAGIILTAAGLGFLGLGAQPPLPEWGAMVASGRRYLIDYWWVATVPGIAIFVVSLGFNLLGDGLRDVFDPKAQK
ncbi:MAG: ABC transporter permease [Alphaproteobacteria bacterium]|nr:MAG: ABC transporter permease [Alphaproteobacteria bacterium]